MLKAFDDLVTETIFLKISMLKACCALPIAEMFQK